MIRRMIAAVAALLLAPAPALAQSYPTKGILLIVPFAAGGPTDIIARLAGEHMGQVLGQQVLVENVAGAGGTVGVARVMRSSPDGYTLLMGNLGTQAASVGLYANLAYDPRKDFEPIMNVAATPMLVAAKLDMPVKDFKEFITYVKANADKISYGTGGVGATSHLTCLFLEHVLGVKLAHVPFRGSGPALNALLGGHVDFVCDQTVGVVPAIQARQIKGLVVATPQRLAVVPDVPTSTEQGLAQFQATGWNALFAPKGTPREIIERLNKAASAAVDDARTKSRLLDLGADIPDVAGRTPEVLSALVSSEIDKWVPVIKAAGVKAN